jgi:REP element-mobilizing transposase RayT
MQQSIVSVLRELRQTGGCETYAFVVMPDHLHVILRPKGLPLSKIMRILKGKSARLINRQRQAHGTIWQERYYEHTLRDEKDFRQKYQYILYNPVTAGLSKEPEDYPHSSAHLQNAVDPIP